MDLKSYLKEIETFLIKYLKDSHCEKYVLGVSGGVDSSLCAAILKNAVSKEKVHCLIIPIDSSEEDIEDGLTLVKDLGLSYDVIDATEIFNSYVEQFKNNNIELDRATLGNLKARIRMSILYAVAQKEHGLVVGTDNADERYIGYFTKYGDGACDVLPIAHLVKKEVVEAAKIYGVRDSLAERIPTAGLYQGQTDEKEMGVTYQELDAYLLGKEISNSSLERIEYLRKISEHKIKEIPMPEKFERDNK
ncbi:MAG: NAD(+) synthase [Bacilli bacterium]|nr:NAD(+) synthase [Bacilli bacterium]